MHVPDRLFIAFSLLFLSGCASVNAPEGGPRDEQKPRLTSISPQNEATNFKGKVITMTFDEDVRPRDINKQLIVTPNTGNTYTVRNDRNRITIEFRDDLEPNTTYLLNFREGIEDVTESNKAEPITLAFSTGSELDTGKVTGEVVYYMNQKPESNITVGLYPESDTNNIRDHRPYYFAKTGVLGKFELNNIKAGNYRIFAHNDKNGNEFYDQENERIGYLLQPISVNPVADSIKLQTVLLDTRKPFVLSTENFLDQNTLVYNEGIRSIRFNTVTQPQNPVQPVTQTSEDGKRITVYPMQGVLPAELIAFSLDSAGNTGIDTVRFSLSGKKAIPNTLSIQIAQSEVQQGVENTIKIKFPVPVQITGKTPFTITEDSVKTIKPEYPKSYSLNNNKTELHLKYTPRAKKQVILEMDTTQILAINGQAFSKQIVPLGISRKTTTGSISGQIKTSYTNYWVELLNEQGKVVDVKENVRTLNYPNLEPGNYQLRVKIDENKNGKWELGDKLLKTKPEKVYLYPQPIGVRANWEIADLILIF